MQISKAGIYNTPPTYQLVAIVLPSNKYYHTSRPHIIPLLPYKLLDQLNGVENVVPTGLEAYGGMLHWDG